MKFIFFILIVFFIFVNCARLEVVELQEDNSKIYKNFYVYDDDRVSVYYDFWAEDGQIYFYIYNKLNIPVYIDWQQSYFKFNDKKYYYVLPLANKNINEKIDVIQPKSFIKNKPIKVDKLLEPINMVNAENIDMPDKKDFILVKKNPKNLSQNYYLNFLTLYAPSKTNIKKYDEYNVINNFAITEIKMIREKTFMGNFYNPDKKNDYAVSPYYKPNSFFIIVNKK
ncbi:MAG TPA: hypothetical protein PLJ38_00445 [bacterium]|nr:hypothetical protein [bacterium]